MTARPGPAPRRILRGLLAGEDSPRPLVDVASSSVTGLRAPAGAAAGAVVGHPVLQTRALGGREHLALGSDAARVGLLFDRPELDDETYLDAFGVRWLWCEGHPGVLGHPLGDAGPRQVARHPRPVWPARVQVADGVARRLGMVTVADAPCAGILETSLALRGGWRFMDDLAGEPEVAHALLDWSLEAVLSGYEAVLGGLDEPPDLVVYGDDYGYHGGMLLSPAEFDAFVRPRLGLLLERLRALTPAAVVFHSCGAVAPVAPVLADLGVDLLNLQPDARGVDLVEMRRRLPAAMPLHGVSDLVGVGRALEAGDHAAVAEAALLVGRAWPVVVAPVDVVDDADGPAAARAARWFAGLDGDDIGRLRAGRVPAVRAGEYPRAGVVA